MNHIQDIFLNSTGLQAEVIQPLISKFPNEAYQIVSQNKHYVIQLTPRNTIESISHGKENFYKETASISRIYHSCVLKLLSVGENKNFFYQIQQDAVGESLSLKLQKEILSNLELLKLAKTLTELLIEIQQYGLKFFELDVKNIFFDSRRDFKIKNGIALDFEHQTEYNLLSIGAILFECVTQNKLNTFPVNNTQRYLSKKLDGLDLQNPAHIIIQKILNNQSCSNFKSTQNLLNQLQKMTEPTQLGLTYYPTPFINRTYQVTQIDLPFQKLMKGQGSTVLLQGPSGTGKTRFEVEISKDFNRRGAFNFHARANDYKTPFSALISAFDEYLQQVNWLSSPPRSQHEEAIRHATGKFSAIFQKYCPLLSKILTPSKITKIEKAPIYVNQAWIEFFCKLSKKLGQIVIIFDDPKLLDIESAFILKELIQQTANYPILLVVSGESNSESIQFLHESMKMTETFKIDFDFFTDSELRILFQEYFQQKSLPSEIQSFLTEQSHGDLLIINQLLNEFFQSGLLIPEWNKYIINPERTQSLELPESIDKVRSSKLSSLSKVGQSLLKSAALLGEAFTAVELSKIHQISEVQIANELSKADFFIFTHFCSYQWIHLKLRNFIVSLMSESEIQELRQSIIKRTFKNVDLSKLNHYFKLAFHTEKVNSLASTLENWEIFYLAAHEATETFAFNTAYRLLQYCTKLTNESIYSSHQISLRDYFVFFAEVCFQIGNHHEAYQHFSSALKYSHSGVEKANIYLNLANLNLIFYHPDLAKVNLEKALKELNLDRNNIFAIKSKELLPYLYKYQNQAFFESQQNNWIEVTQELQKYLQQMSNFLPENDEISKTREKKLECILAFSLGSIKNSQKLAMELLTQDSFLLDQIDLIELSFFLMTTYFLQGKIQEANQVIETPNLKILDTLNHSNTPNDPSSIWLKIWKVAAISIFGKIEESRSLILEIEEKFSENLNESDFFRTFHLTSQLIYFYFTNQIGEAYEKVEQTFDDLNSSPSNGAWISHLGFVVIAYCRLQNYVQAEIATKEEKLKRFISAIEHLRKLAKNPLVTPHLKCLESALLLTKNDMDSSWTHLAEGEKLGLESENSWALFQITLQKSRFLNQRGHLDGALNCLEHAFEFAKNNQWSLLLEGIKKEFKIEHSPRFSKFFGVEKENDDSKKTLDSSKSSSPHSKQSTSSPRSDSTQGYVDALLKLNREKSRLAKDLEVTGIVQSLLLPKESLATTEYFRMASFYQSAAQSGGDWWWYEKDSENGLSIILADVTGHGAGSAMVTATVASSYRTLTGLRGTDQKIDFSWLFPKINANLYSICAGTYGMTLSAFQFSKQGNLNCWCAGAPPLMILKHSTGEVVTRFMPSTSLGSPEITVTQENIQLEQGDRIFVFTDGAYEFPTSTRPNFGLKGLRKLLASTHGKAIESARHLIAQEIESLRTTSTLSDDLTFILVDYI